MGVRVILVCNNIKCGSNYGLDFPSKKQIFFPHNSFYILLEQSKKIFWQFFNWGFVALMV